MKMHATSETSETNDTSETSETNRKVFVGEMNL
jgi:hypothetical protein